MFSLTIDSIADSNLYSQGQIDYAIIEIIGAMNEDIIALQNMIGRSNDRTYNGNYINVRIDRETCGVCGAPIGVCEYSPADGMPCNP